MSALRCEANHIPIIASQNSSERAFICFEVNRAFLALRDWPQRRATISSPRFCHVVRTSLIALLPFAVLSIALAQGAKKTLPETPIRDADADHEEKRSEWFLRGRMIPGKSSAKLRHRACQTKMQARAVRLSRSRLAQPNSQSATASGEWTPLGPAPLASDATGTGFQDYRQVSGRATAVAIDPADATGNTLYIGRGSGRSVDVDECGH
jgi:hypothetical protein